MQLNFHPNRHLPLICFPVLWKNDENNGRIFYFNYFILHARATTPVVLTTARVVQAVVVMTGTLVSEAPMEGMEETRKTAASATLAARASKRSNGPEVLSTTPVIFHLRLLWTTRMMGVSMGRP